MSKSKTKPQSVRVRMLRYLGSREGGLKNGITRLRLAKHVHKMKEIEG